MKNLVALIDLEEQRATNIWQSKICLFVDIFYFMT